MERTKTLSKKAQKGFTIFSENKTVNTSNMSSLRKKYWCVWVVVRAILKAMKITYSKRYA